jgi:HK97 family phage major capsid protein
MEMNEVLKRLLQKQDEAKEARAALLEQRNAIIEAAKSEIRESDELTEAEQREFDGYTADIKAIDAELAERDVRIKDLHEEDSRADAAAIAARRADMVRTSVQVKSEERTYVAGNGRSYLQDLALASIRQDPQAQERLARHAGEVATEPEYRDLIRTDGNGGYFVPPIHLVSQYEALARAGRPTANLVTNLPLPGGTDSINVPRVSTGTTTAIQTADNQSSSETDLADAIVTAGVKTITGQQDMAIQLLDQSPINFDEVVFGDLIADYATKVDLQVLTGANSAGEVKGIVSASGINLETYTDTTPTVGEFYSKLASAISLIHTSRYMAPSVIVMHPRRWAWLLAATDTTGRPLVTPNGHGPNNATGLQTAVASEQVVGSMQGLPIVTDPSIGILSGAGTNEDKVIVMRAADSYLWESAIRTRVLPDVGSGTLTVRLQVYGYLAFTAERQPKSICVIGGTGLAAPTF